MTSGTKRTVAERLKCAVAYLEQLRREAAQKRKSEAK